ncbi:MAG TPA: hypothetical protein P5121_16280 [Caldilineaceae bacterium]|nr:hypothetical protein [Caldilineaceae bacterium]
MEDRTLQLITAFAQLDANPQITAVLMEMVEVDRRLVRYMAGPVILHRSPWVETLPAWVIPAVYADRAEQIAQEVREETFGELATTLEVMAYMYPATLDTPLSYEWVQVYLYCGQEALAKHGKLPAGQTFAQAVLGEEQPLALMDYIQSQFLMPLQRDIRRKVVQVAAERGVAKPSRSRPKTLDEAVERAVEEEQERLPYGPLQMSLLELGE